MTIAKKTVKAGPKRLSAFAPSANKESEYEKDFYKWTRNQARLLKKQKFSNLDIANLAEEIESLGRSDKRALKSYFIVLLHHLLKVKYQPNYQTNSWHSAIENSRREIDLILDDSPSLKRELKNIVEYAFPIAIEKALI